MVGALFYKSLMFIKRSFRETVWIAAMYLWFFGLLLVKPYWTLAPLVGSQPLELFLYCGAVMAVSMQFYSLIVRDDIRSGVLQRVCLERRPLLGYIAGAAALPALMGFVFGASLIAVYCAVDGSAAFALMQHDMANAALLITALVALAVSSAPPWVIVFGDSDDMQCAYIATVLVVLAVAVLMLLPRLGILGVSAGLWAVSAAFFMAFRALARRRFRPTGVVS